MTSQNKALRNALAFARDGYPVLALHGIVDGGCTCGAPARVHAAGKHPHVGMSPHGIDSAITDCAKIKKWWDRYPYLNYGICTDKLVVVDIDPRHDGDETARELEREHGEFPLTWRQITGGLGEHIIYARPTGLKLSCSKDRLGSGVEIKADRGYIVGPGSMHISGRGYEWSVDHFPGQVDLAYPPDWLLEKLAKKEDKGPKPEGYWRDFAARTYVEGQRTEALTKFVGYLFSPVPMLDPDVVLEAARGWNVIHCSPLLTDEELEKHVAGIALCEISKRGAGK